jgi:hypothetical protein
VRRKGGATSVYSPEDLLNKKRETEKDILNENLLNKKVC